MIRRPYVHIHQRLQASVYLQDEYVIAPSRYIQKVKYHKLLTPVLQVNKMITDR